MLRSRLLPLRTRATINRLKNLTDSQTYLIDRYIEGTYVESAFSKIAVASLGFISGTASAEFIAGGMANPCFLAAAIISIVGIIQA
jgi:hypothetical protein